ncbi:ABC transporter ATP-binding protein [Paenibacillus tengchongensis]|uniref:ABC transporter ATP-binding protein n=1 Tax=Paenibacillus tengchongensis TaxID=2608684 RepID=UPI001651BE2D|nr:ATP-binding cassette domain-containing protein [Paenibacillus tengchongensis]
MSYIEVKGLSKKYKVFKRTPKKGIHKFSSLFSKNEFESVDAIKNLSFTIEKQDIVGYIGPNGAGKSTTIKLLAGILQPDSGTCLVDGEIPWKSRKEYVKNIGVMFGQRSQLLWDLPAKDSFEMLKGIYKLSEAEYNESLALLIRMLSIEELINTPVRQLSLGQRVRCELAATFLHRPKLVFLDEPTIGIDIEMKKKFHNFIKEINEVMGVTIFITTHDLDDIQSLCNKLIIINKGEIYFNDKIDKLFSDYFVEKKVYVELAEDEELVVPPKARINKREGRNVVVVVEDSGIVGNVINSIARDNNILNIYVEKLDIEDIILKIYKDFQLQNNRG